MRDLDELLGLARRAAAAAAAPLHTARPLDVRHKGNPRDLVTEWDLRSEAIIREVLSAGAPDIGMLGEEGGATGVVGGARWLVDPIDGTVNFAHGLPLWAVSIGLEDEAGLAVGVVHAPALRWECFARRGGGAWHVEFGDAPQRLQVSPTAAFAEALLVTGFPPDLATNPNNNLDAWAHMYRHAGSCRRLGAASLDLCLVARGALDGYWETRLQPWDLAAGALIVQEAGGTVTDMRGGRFDPHHGEVVASNATLHAAIVAELAQVAAARSAPDA